jgi:hypothetical protein
VLQTFFHANIDKRPIMVYGGNRPAETLERLLEDESLVEEEFYHVPYGLLDRIVRTSEQRPNIHWCPSIPHKTRSFSSDL